MTNSSRLLLSQFVVRHAYLRDYHTCTTYNLISTYKVIILEIIKVQSLTRYSTYSPCSKNYHPRCLIDSLIEKYPIPNVNNVFRFLQIAISFQSEWNVSSIKSGKCWWYSCEIAKTSQVTTRWVDNKRVHFTMLFQIFVVWGRSQRVRPLLHLVIFHATRLAILLRQNGCTSWDLTAMAKNSVENWH